MTFYNSDSIPTNATMSVADMTSEFPGLSEFGRLGRHVGENVNIPVDLKRQRQSYASLTSQTIWESRYAHNLGQFFKIIAKCSLRKLVNIVTQTFIFAWEPSYSLALVVAKANQLDLPAAVQT